MRKKRFIPSLVAGPLLATMFGVVSATAPAAQAAAAAVSCVKPYAASNPPAVSSKPSTRIGTIGKRPPAPYKPYWDGNDRVNDLAYSPTLGEVIAGGWFGSYIWGGKTYVRHNLVAFNAATGQPTAFAPDVNGEILAVAFSCDARSVFIGGTFTQVNGQARSHLARLSLLDGSLSGWNPAPNGTVEDINLARGQVVVAGSFSRIGGAARTGLASVSLYGRVTSYIDLKLTGYETPGGFKVTKAVPDHHGLHLVLLGNFNYVNGQPHRRIAVVYLPGTVAQLDKWWTPETAANGDSNDRTDCRQSFSAPDLDVAFTPNDKYFLTAHTGGETVWGLCDRAVKWSATAMGNTRAEPVAVQCTGGDSLSAIVATDYTVWASGHERWANNCPSWPLKKVQHCSAVAPVDPNPGYAGMNCKGPGAVDRPGLVGLTLSNMRANSWNPTRSKQVGMHNAMILTPQGLWIGTDGDYAGNNTGSSTAANLPHNDLALFPFA